MLKLSTRPKPQVPAHLVAASEWARRQLDKATDETVRRCILWRVEQDLAVLEHQTRFWQAARRNAAADEDDRTRWQKEFWYDVIVMRTALHRLNQLTHHRPEYRDGLNRASRYYRLHYRLCAQHRPRDSWRTIQVELLRLNHAWFLKA